jgi:arginine transport system substrate-binding protein
VKIPRFINFIVFFFMAFSLQAKNLVIGTIANAPPFEYQVTTNELVGFDIDLMHALCKRTHHHCSFKLYDFHGLFSAIKHGEIDLAIAGIIISQERRKQFLFSLPYKINTFQYLTLANSTVTNIKQLQGKRIGVYKNSPEDEVVYKHFSGHLNITFYEHVDDMLEALEHKDVDAIVMEYSRAIYWISNSKKLKMLGRPFRSGEGYGIAAKLDKTELIDEINKSLTEMENDGTYLQLYQTYF